MKTHSPAKIQTPTTLVFLALTLAALMTAGCSQKAGETTALDARFNKTGGVEFVQDGVSVLSSDVSAFASGLSVSLGLTIHPPAPSQTGGVQVYASDLKVAGTKVITGYNVPGATDRGWIDYIDVTTLAVPLLVGSQYFADTDINGVAMNGSGGFALVGAKENIGSVLRTGTYGLLGTTLNPTETFLSSYAGTGITYNAAGTQLALTTGNGGGVSVLNSTTLSNIAAEYTLSDARAVTYHAGTSKYFAVKGQTGEVHAFNASGAHLSSVSIGGASIGASKSTIVAGSEFLLATSGDGGFSVLCAADLGIAAQQAQYVYTNYSTLGLPGPTATVSNAAAFGPGMIFVAAGQAGVRVYNFVKKTGTSPTACQNVEVSYMGYFEFTDSVTANNLVYANILTTPISYSGVLYVANGGNGFKAVTITATRSSLNDILNF